MATEVITDYLTGRGTKTTTENLNRQAVLWCPVQNELRRKNLVPTNNLRSIFRKLKGFITANASGTTQNEMILNQLVLLIITKLYDERYFDAEDFADFRVWNDDAKITAKKIKQKFREAKTRWKSIFDESDEITLDDEVILKVVTQLQRFSLEKSPRHAVSEAFESIISYASRSLQGQFFTPANITELMIEIAKPNECATIFDPACGTAGFLSSGMFHVWREIDGRPISDEAKNELKQTYATSHLIGMEKDSFLAKIAKAYMIIIGDGKSGIFAEDSLNESSWRSATKAEVLGKQFEIILTNPPFGKELKLRPTIAKKFEFGNKIELAFVEQCQKYLKDGGTMGIILPETIFHSLSNQIVREKLFYGHNITHIIDLPHDTFRPYNNAKTDIVFIQKNRPQQEKIIAIKVNEIGHDRSGNQKFRLNKNHKLSDLVADDVPHIIRMLRGEQKVDSDFIKTIPASKLLANDLLVARPYFIKSDNKKLVSLGELAEDGTIEWFDGHGSPEDYLKGLGEYPYVRVKDIVNLEVAHNRLDDIPEIEYRRLWSPKKALKPKDIVFVRRGSYRIGDVGMLYEKDMNSVLTREILVIRVKDDNPHKLTPFALLGFLNSTFVREQINNKVLVDTTLPNIAERWKDLRIDVDNENLRTKYNTAISKMYQQRSSFWNGYGKIFGVNG
ncbi:MAG: N-6 DNA methylase [Candidatus Nomurabacteria bacterium]|jgi:type I restriction enzyme M protein|nr:N-6 DNA methylase [Candidatus Nomurabacteria bacterium]